MFPRVCTTFLLLDSGNKYNKYALKRLQNLRELSVAARGSKRTRLVPDGFRGVAALIASAWAQGAVLWKSWERLVIL